MVQWLAGVFVIRALTGEPMPLHEDADRLVDITLRAIMKDGSGSDAWSDSQTVHAEFGDSPHSA